VLHFLLGDLHALFYPILKRAGTVLLNRHTFRQIAGLIDISTT
jgi:hypothetical protein